MTDLSRIDFSRCELRLLTGMMLTGGGRKDVAPGAVRSVPFVDHMLFIETDETSPETIAACVKVCEELRIDWTVSKLPFVFDCAKARNFGIDEAHRLGFEWCMPIDTDERFEVRGVDIRDALPKTDADLIIVWERSMQYPKARFIRTSTKGRYHYPVHEELLGAESFVVMNVPRFWEMPKSEEEMVARQWAVLRIATDWSEREPTNSRPLMHIANYHYWNAERTGEAASWDASREFFERALAVSHVDEERAMAKAYIARCHHELGDNRAAIDWACRSIAEVPYKPEAYMVAAFAAAKEGRWFDAIAFAIGCIGMGKASQFVLVAPVSTLFSWPSTHYEAPWQVLGEAYDQLGFEQARDQAVAMAEKLAAERERVTA